MAYIVYKTLRTKEEFYKGWEKDQLIRLDEDMKDIVYKKYVVKCLVLQRDDFTCQNKDCTFCSNVYEAPNLTRHHIKFQKNNGKDSLKNSIIVCKGSHKRYHSGKSVLAFRGMTYRIHKREMISKKFIKKEGKVTRRKYKEYYGATISWELVRLLMRFLEIDFSQFEEDDD